MQPLAKSVCISTKIIFILPAAATTIFTQILAAAAGTVEARDAILQPAAKLATLMYASLAGKYGQINQ